MSWLHIICALVLLVAIGAGLVRILAGPTVADRMMAAQLFGTCGVAILLLLAKGLDRAVLMDIALVLALLAPLATTTFVRRAWYGGDQEEESDGVRP